MKYLAPPPPSIFFSFLEFSWKSIFPSRFSFSLSSAGIFVFLTSSSAVGELRGSRHLSLVLPFSFFGCSLSFYYICFNRIAELIERDREREKRAESLCLVRFCCLYRNWSIAVYNCLWLCALVFTLLFLLYLDCTVNSFLIFFSHFFPFFWVRILRCYPSSFLSSLPPSFPHHTMLMGGSYLSTHSFYSNLFCFFFLHQFQHED